MDGPEPSTGLIDLCSLPLQTESRLDVPVDGGTAPVVVDVWVGAAHHPCLALVAGVHGDEYEGILALQEVRRALKPGQLLGTLLFVHVANPFAYAAAQRRTPQDDMDLNRVFPGRADGFLTERLAEVLCRDVLSQADAVFTLHGAGAKGVLSPWVEFLDVPGAVGQASYEMARASGFSDLIALPKLPGRLLAAMGELGVPLVEGEVGGRATTRRENVSFYVDRVRAIARHVGVSPIGGVSPVGGVSVDDAHSAPERSAPRIWHLGPAVPAEAGGILVREVTLKQTVRAGERLGVIRTMRGDVAAEVRAPVDGVVGGYRDHAGVRRGETVFTLWTPKDE